MALGDERVGAGGGGDRRRRNGLAEVVRAGERQRDAGDARVVRVVDAIAVDILVDQPADRDRQHVAEVVVHAVLAVADQDRGDRVGRDQRADQHARRVDRVEGTMTRSDSVEAVELLERLDEEVGVLRYACPAGRWRRCRSACTPAPGHGKARRIHE